MDFNESLRRAIKTGKVFLGQNSTEECVNAGKAQLVVIARNCPAAFKEAMMAREDVSTYVYEDSGKQLGKACGRPHVVSALAIVEAGESDILSIKRA
ncbi:MULTISPECIES: 50S ribosomal protein L30e [Methanofollis]|jgi:large subunit ribosomal protein L30e|uniref:50S ribosomal protein L30e n=3 Tax=Methanofollis TaxID=81416 RepID=A0A7K4HRK0_9EURY|nr:MULTISPECIES: 50S ribosomal protein L30e [Methanofollis]EJG07923.1 ribosomal protein L7Ae/L30e/S12e/Gadd45 [Methanofollis liminatans DSM 4140]NVO67490.1 50S ribosomal protein L30e [Methanofollis tationis]HDS62596.1 50S ribosomal protein L30e [Methanofollis liminatans]